MFAPPSPLRSVRDTVRDAISQTFRGEQEIPDSYRAPLGDPGWFGPGTVTWTVHSDLPSMLVGGIAAILLQTLHPLAMAGVAEHSDYRNDPLGRLQRTAEFIGTTTFANSQAAADAVRAVREIHTRVIGVAPDGRPYSANDPELLTWVHTAEVTCFARAYRRFGPKPMPLSDVNRYFAEMARVAVALGASNVPETWDEARAYFHTVRAQLSAGSQAFNGIDYVVNAKSAIPPEEAIRSLLIQAAIGVLPPWARQLGGLRQPGQLEGVAVDTAWRGIGAFIRWALGPSQVMEIAAARTRGTLSSAAA